MAPDLRTDDAAPTLDRLADVLDRHGTDQAQWPQADQESLARLIARSPHAHVLFAAAAKLDGALDALKPPKPSTRLADDLLHRRPPARSTQPPVEPRETRGWSPWLRPAQVSFAAILAVAAVALLAFALIETDAPRAPQSTSLQASSGTQTSDDDDNLFALNEATHEASDEPTDNEDSIALIEVSIALRDDFENFDALNQLPLE